MKKDVLIDIKSLHQVDDASDTMELTTIGSFTRMNGNYYITYRESEATGLDGVVTTLKVEGDRKVTLIRGGAQDSRLVLEKGQRHHCAYDTGFGAMMVGIFAEQIDVELKETGGKLHFRYNLDINADLASRNDVQITIREAGNNSCQM